MSKISEVLISTYLTHVKKILNSQSTHTIKTGRYNLIYDKFFLGK